MKLTLKKIKKPVAEAVDPNLEEKKIGPSLSFAAAEAYKLLRTNIMFSIPTKKCRIIGITSALMDEGKSTTSVNLAYTIAETNKRVLLIEGDMRRPSIYKYTKTKNTPGLSNMLAGLCTGKDVLQHAFLDNFYIITSGDIPPNPSELLGSESMRELIGVLSEEFDFIIVDLPPVNAVADALVASEMMDGMIMVVKQNYNNRSALAEAVNQLKFAKAKLLGFVMTGAQSKNGYYKKYSRYSKDYGYGYGYGETKK